MWHFVYILRNQIGEQYVGHSNNLKVRLQQHNNGDVPATVDGKPWRIEWFCSFRTTRQAVIFEKYLKSGSGSVFRFRHLVSKK